MKNIVDNKIWELIGIIIGDGNLWSNSTHWRIEVTGDKIKDKDYFFNYIKPLLNNYTKNKIRFRERQRALRLRICSKDLFHLLTNLGLYERREKLKNLEFLEKLSLYKSILVIRGLADTDGCVCKTKRGIIYVQVATCSKFLAYWLLSTLEKLGFKSYVSKCRDKRPNRKDIFRVYVYGESDLRKWLKIIGFSNKYKFDKALKILSNGTDEGQ